MVSMSALISGTEPVLREEERSRTVKLESER
jgi:hypothetical protein